jgi:hypothetical protein
VGQRADLALTGRHKLPSRAPDELCAFSLSSPSRIRAILAAAGFTDVELEAVEEPLRIAADKEAAFRFLTGLSLVEAVLRGRDNASRATAR